MIKAIFYLAILLGSAFAGQVSFTCNSNKHRYEVYDGPFATNECEARKRCHDKGGYLADVDDHAEFMELIGLLGSKCRQSQKFYIHAWQSDTYGKACIAFYQGGAITVPPEGCAGPVGYICEYDQ